MWKCKQSDNWTHDVTIFIPPASLYSFLLVPSVYSDHFYWSTSLSSSHLVYSCPLFKFSVSLIVKICELIFVLGISLFKPSQRPPTFTLLVWMCRSRGRRAARSAYTHPALVTPDCKLKFQPVSRLVFISESYLLYLWMCGYVVCCWALLIHPFPQVLFTWMIFFLFFFSKVTV